MPDAVSAHPKNRERAAPVKPALAGRGMRALVAAMIIVAFAGMLLATHYFVSKQRGQNNQQQSANNASSFVGREGRTTTDVNLRPDPSTSNTPVGLAEGNSRVRVLSISNNWYEVQVIEHGRDKINPDSPDRGWIHKRFLEFN
jgi:hypothetical protein